MRKYNNDVDTNYKVQGIVLKKESLKLKESNEYKKDSDEELDIELYTTMHRVAAQDIYDMIKEYLVKRGEVPPDEDDGEGPTHTANGIIHQNVQEEAELANERPRQNQIVSAVEDLE